MGITGVNIQLIGFLTYLLNPPDPPSGPPHIGGLWFRDQGIGPPNQTKTPKP